MPPVGAERWFHTLVVVGASLTGCGDVMSDTNTLPTGGSGSGSGMSTGGASNGGASGGGLGSGGALTGPSICAYDAQFVCDDYAKRTNCRCDTTAPRQMSDCASPLDYQCTRLPCTSPSGQLCLGDDFVGCRCDPSGLRPSDCATPEQFFCGTDEGFFADCECSPVPQPTECGNQSVCCQSDNPRFGCDCCPAIIK
jgi:hypothetical protein